jgi:hypothetical protein
MHQKARKETLGLTGLTSRQLELWVILLDGFRGFARLCPQVSGF